jgi:hypothetical protein
LFLKAGSAVRLVASVEFPVASVEFPVVLFPAVLFPVA